MANVANIKYYDVANGLGVRISIFFAGCTFHCKECFNEIAWNFDYGYEFNHNVYVQDIKNHMNNSIQGLSILGGEPMHPKNVNAILKLVQWFKHDFPNKDIWLWTGYKYEDLIQIPINLELLQYVDILVDGQFIKELKDLSLKFRGSSNQRIIEVSKSLKTNSIVLSDLNKPREFNNLPNSH